MTKVDTLFENEDYIFLNKPAGLSVIPDRHLAHLPSLQQILQQRLNNIFTVHRIDRETSGIICFAKNAAAHRHASMAFEHRKVEKVYHCIVHGSLQKDDDTIQAPIMEHPTQKGKYIVHAKRGKESITEYKILKRYGRYTHIECILHTGRTHQIRVHMQHLGHPIVSDILYGDGKPVYISTLKKNYNLAKFQEEEQPIIKRLALHAYSLSFVDQYNNKISVSAPLPKDMSAFLKQCEKWLVS